MSCKGCSTNIVKVEALPCDASDAAQQGWAFGAADAEGLRTITRGGLCLSWNPNHKGVELRECYAANGDSWTNATVRDCQHFAVDEAGGAITAPRCANNEGNFGGCLDVHGKVGPGVQLTRCYGAPNDNFTLAAGAVASREVLPTYPGRCFAARASACTFAECCDACAAGFAFDEYGFCREPALRPKKVNIFLATPTNLTSLGPIQRPAASTMFERS